MSAWSTCSPTPRAEASIPALAFATEFRGWVSLRRGRLADAEEDARTALELLTTHATSSSEERSRWLF